MVNYTFIVRDPGVCHAIDYLIYVIVDKTIIIKTIRILIDDDRVERSDNRDFVSLLFKSFYGHHTVKFARLVHLDFLLKSSLSFYPP